MFALVEAQAAKGPGAKPVLTIAEFSDGNDQDGASLGCNLQPEIPLARLRAVFESVSRQPSVEAVWIAITDHDRELGWPFADDVLLSTNGALPEVEG